jgi:hypothetical protein
MSEIKVPEAAINQQVTAFQPTTVVGIQSSLTSKSQVSHPFRDILIVKRWDVDESSSTHKTGALATFFHANIMNKGNVRLQELRVRLVSDQPSGRFTICFHGQSSGPDTINASEAMPNVSSFRFTHATYNSWVVVPIQFPSSLDMQLQPTPAVFEPIHVTMFQKGFIGTVIFELKVEATKIFELAEDF